MKIDPAILKQLRQTAGWSQTALAERADLGQSYLSELESGRKDPSSMVVGVLAQVLGVTVDALACDVTPRTVCPHCGRTLRIVLAASTR